MDIVGGQGRDEAQDAVVQIVPQDAAHGGVEPRFFGRRHAAASWEGERSLAARTRATSRFRLSAGMRPFERRSIAKDTETLADRLPASKS